MKLTYIIAILILAFMNGVYQYSVKKDFKPSELDKYVTGMRGADTVLPEGTNISFSTIGVPVDLQTRIRYIFAPRLLSLSNTSLYDTLLTVSSLHKKDSILDAFNADGSRIIWQNQDTTHFYILSSKHK